MEFNTKALRPDSLVQRSMLIRPKHPVIVPDVPWESAVSICRRRRKTTRKRSGKRTAEPTAQAKNSGERTSTDIHRWGKSLRYQDRGVKRKTRSFVSPFPFLELTVKNVCKGLIC